MIPYFPQPVWHLGPITIHAFGLTIAGAVALGLSAAARRFRSKGLDVALGERIGWWTLIGGILGAHLFSVLFYFPEKVKSDPLVLLRLWEDISSFGGILGGAIGALIFFAVRANAKERLSKLAYLDAMAFVFPAALAVGRIGCALAHDHPGRVTTFPLAISLRSDEAMQYISGKYADAGMALPTITPGMGFHDLGLYECLYLSCVVVPALLLLNRKQRPVGFFLAAFAAFYLPVRFGLDVLRIADVRYVGLTPAQWVAVIGMVVWPFAVARARANQRKLPQANAKSA